jgi:hypothetical protein
MFTSRQIQSLGIIMKHFSLLFFLYFFYIINGYTTLLLGLGRFFSLFILYTVGNTLDGESARRKTSTYTHYNAKQKLKHKDIRASIGILTHDPSIREDETSSCLRPHGH